MEKNALINNDVCSFWNSRAGLGMKAGSKDIIAKHLEIEAISSYVKNGMRILDFGCGNGVTAIELAMRYEITVMGLDYAPEMVGAAQELANNVHTKGMVQFRVGDLNSLQSLSERFDMIYSERTLINLKDWPEQKRAIAALTNLLVPGGIYVMCENSDDGLQDINALRHDVGLDSITAPWHNRYIKDDEVAALSLQGITLEEINYYSSTYYFLSRVVNAFLAAREGVQPDYDAPVNQLALSLPPIGRMGQGRIWILRRQCGVGMQQCLICESKISIAFRKNGYAYFRCGSCGMLLVDLHLTPVEVFSHYSEDYFEAQSSGAAKSRRGYPSYRGAQDTLRASFEDKLTLVRSYVHSGRLLDAGAAYGLFLQTASPYFECMGIDVSEYASSVARDEFGMNVQARDIVNTGFPDNHFDLVVLWDIIEHLIQPMEALVEVHRILKPGGRVFISTDDASNWLPRMLGSRWWALGAPMHLCHFSKKGMIIALQRAGLEIDALKIDRRRYSVAEIIKHFGVSYQSGFLTSLGNRMEKNAFGRLVLHVTRPEQFIAIGRKPRYPT